MKKLEEMTIEELKEFTQKAVKIYCNNAEPIGKPLVIDMGDKS